MSVTPIPVIIEAVQFTPSLDAMIVQVAAQDPTHPLLGTARQIATTQREVAGAADADLATVAWGDEEIAATVVARFADWGIPVTVVDATGD
jgi:putative heme iron utilization protein